VASLLDLIDEFRPRVVPLPRRRQALRPAGRRLQLRLVEQRPFRSGLEYLRYQRIR
jgi:hypothetical protein